MSSFSIVPNDILYCIFSTLPKKAIQSLFLTDKRICEFISNYQPLWQNLLPSHYPLLFPCPVNIPDAKGTYLQINAQEKNIRKKKFRSDIFPPIHHKAVTGLATQGTTLISGSHDKTIKVTDLKTGKLRTIRVDHKVDCVAMHGNLFCSGSYDGGPIIVSNWKTGEKLFTLEGHQAGVRCLAIHNGRLISGSTDKSIKIWDLESGKLLQSWDNAHENEVRAIFVQGDTLYSSCVDGTLKAWDLNSKTELFTLKIHVTGYDEAYDSAECIEVRGNTMITGHYSGWIKIWDLTDRKLVKEWPAHEYAVKSVAILGNILFSASTDKTICGHDLENGSRVFWSHSHQDSVRSHSHQDSVKSLALQNGVLYSGAFDTKIRSLDFNYPSLTPYDAKTLEANLSILKEMAQAEEKGDAQQVKALAQKLHPDFQERLRQHGFKCCGSFQLTKEVIERVRTEVHLEYLLDRLHADDQKKVDELLKQFFEINVYASSLYAKVHGSIPYVTNQEEAVLEFKENLKLHWGADLPLLLADLDIVTDEEFSQKLQCTRDHLKNVGIVSIADLQALGILCTAPIPHLLFTQTQLGEKRKQVLDVLKNLSAEIQKRRDESDHFGVALFTDADGDTIGDDLSPWAVFQNQFNEIKAQLEEICSSPANLSKDNGELLEKTNALIDQFNALEREYQIIKLRAYIHQPHIREIWDALANSSLADYAQKNPKAKLYEMVD